VFRVQNSDSGRLRLPKDMMTGRFRPCVEPEMASPSCVRQLGSPDQEKKKGVVANL